MKTIKMIFGSYGAPDGRGRVRLIDCGQTCEVEDAEEERLIDLRVAQEVVATPKEREEPIKAGENTPDASDAQEGITGHLDPEELSNWTVAQLKQLAEDMELDTSKCRVKADYVALISEAEVSVPAEDEADEEDDTVDDGELPPDLEAEAPVV